MKTYQRKIMLDKDCSDGTRATPRKYFNSSERQHAKREIASEIEYLEEHLEIKVRDIWNLRHELDQRLENIRYDFAHTLHRFGMSIHPGGYQTFFENSYHYHDFDYSYDSANLSEAELLEILATLPSRNPDRYY